MENRKMSKDYSEAVKSRNMDMYRRKGAFVAKLSNLLHEADPDIAYLQYSVDWNFEECVEIHYQSGLIRKVNVSCDSHMAIAKDVMMKI